MRAKSLVVFVVVALFAVTPCAAQGNDGQGNGLPAGQGLGNPCSLNGTWVGDNTLGLQYLMSITWVSGKHFKSVAEGVNDLSGFGCFSGTAFRGDVKKTGPMTYEATWLAFCDAGLNYPLVWGSKATFEQTDCDVLDVDLEFTAAYLWGDTPFVSDPISGTVVLDQEGLFTRMIMD